MLDLEFNVRPSKILKLVLVFLYFLSLSLIISLHLYIIYKLISVFIVTVIIVKLNKRYVSLKHPASIHVIKYRQGKEWLIGTTNELRCVNVHKESTVTPLIMILSFTDLQSKKEYSSIIMRDALSRQAYKKLLVGLKAFS